MQHTNNEIMPNLINFGGDLGDLMRSPPNVLRIQINLLRSSPYLTEILPDQRNRQHRWKKMGHNEGRRRRMVRTSVRFGHSGL